MTGRTLPLASAAATLLGPVVWAAHFLTVYTSESLLCRATAEHWFDTVIIAATTVALSVIALHYRKQNNRLDIGQLERFLARAALTLDGLAALAIVIAAAAGIALPACR